MNDDSFSEESSEVCVLQKEKYQSVHGYIRWAADMVPRNMILFCSAVLPEEEDGKPLRYS